MSLIDRFKPHPPPRDPGISPFMIWDRVVVSPHTIDGQFIGGQHGTVLDVEHLPEDPWGPWVIHIRLDGTGLQITASAAELTREKPEPTPLYDDVVEEAKARDGLAAEVESFLADVAGGAR